MIRRMLLWLVVGVMLLTPIGKGTNAGAVPVTLYRRWIAVWNRTGSPLSNYPLEIGSQAGTGFDHASLVAQGKAQADGDDLRVVVDGLEVDRWLDAPNTGHTKVWINLDLQPGHQTTLLEGFGPTEPVTELRTSTTGGFPSSGVLYDVNSGEAFLYTGTSGEFFTGVTRAARGTKAARANENDTLVWIEHDVWLAYGNPGAAPPAVDDRRRPAFRLDSSTNTSWSYEQFGADDGLRSAAWVSEGFGTFYTANHGGFSDPWEEIGTRVEGPHWLRVSLHNPCGIASLSFSGGEKRWEGKGGKIAFFVYVESSDGGSWMPLYEVPPPSRPYDWEAWSYDGDVPSGHTVVGLRNQGGTTGDPFNPVVVYAEVDAATVGLAGGSTPAISWAGEELYHAVEVTIEDDPDPVQAGAPLTYIITVRNTGTFGEEIHAVVTATLPAQVTPSGVITWTPTITAPGGAWSQAVAVTVNGSATGTLTALVTVTTAELVGDTASETTALVTPGVDIYPNRSGVAKPGTAIAYTHTVANTGNIADTYLLDAVGGWPASVEPGSISLGIGASGTVTVTVHVPAGAVSGTVDTTVITATSMTDGLTHGVVTDTTTVPFVAGVQFGPDGAGEGKPGHSILYSHILTNTGNGPDVFQLSHRSSAGWVVTHPVTLALGRGEAAVVGVTVTVPAGAAAGVVDTTVITATSRSDPGVWATVEDRTAVPEGRVYLPLVLRSYPVVHLIADAPDTCPGLAVVLGGHLYRDDFDRANDNDWYRFSAQAGVTYTLRTLDLGPLADTVLYLYAGDCTTLLAWNDDAQRGFPASLVTWRAPTDGEYHILVRAYAWSVYGPGTAYTLEAR